MTEPTANDPSDAAPASAPDAETDDAPKKTDNTKVLKAEHGISQKDEALVRALNEKLKEFAGTRLLVAEDTKPMRMLVVSTFKRLRFNVGEAENGRVALDELTAAADEGRRYQLLLLDLMMPEMNGFDTLKAIRSNPDLASTPVIVLTARCGREDIAKVAKLGVRGYIVKPFTTQKLMEGVHKVLIEQREKQEAKKPRGLNLEDTVELRQMIQEGVLHYLSPDGGTTPPPPVELLNTLLLFLDTRCPKCKPPEEELPPNEESGADEPAEAESARNSEPSVEQAE